MGQTLQIRTSGTPALEWSAFAGACAEVGVSPKIRMIDGLPAFPDEIPAQVWQELRLAIEGEMITIRTLADGYSLTIWGNTSDSLLKSWRWLTYLVAKQLDGRVLFSEGSVSAVEFAAQHQLCVPE